VISTRFLNTPGSPRGRPPLMIVFFCSRGAGFFCCCIFPRIWPETAFSACPGTPGDCIPDVNTLTGTLFLLTARRRPLPPFLSFLGVFVGTLDFLGAVYEASASLLRRLTSLFELGLWAFGLAFSARLPAPPEARSAAAHDLRFALRAGPFDMRGPPAAPFVSGSLLSPVKILRTPPSSDLVGSDAPVFPWFSPVDSPDARAKQTLRVTARSFLRRIYLLRHPPFPRPTPSEVPPTDSFSLRQRGP